MIRLIEELSLNAWPALQVMRYDGWVLRFAAGYTRRANSVAPLYPGRLDLERKIGFCEEEYHRAGLPAIFKLTPAAEPLGLDEFLAGRGYAREAITGVQTLDLAGLPPPGEHAIESAPGASDDWAEAFARLNGVDGRHLATMRAMLRSIRPAARFAAARHEGDIGALGLAVRQGEWVGLFDIVTAPALRRRGLGRAIVLDLLHQARAAGAARAYLQVMLDNEAALGLYTGLGFREAYRYWYRVRRRDDAPALLYGIGSERTCALAP